MTSSIRVLVSSMGFSLDAISAAVDTVQMPFARGVDHHVNGSMSTICVICPGTLAPSLGDRDSVEHDLASNKARLVRSYMNGVRHVAECRDATIISLL